MRTSLDDCSARWRKRLLLAACILAFANACDDDPTTTPTPDTGGDVDASDVVPDADAPAEADLILAIEASSTVSIPALSEPVHVVRTESDIPHIYAANERDLYVAEGYVMARHAVRLLFPSSVSTS